jgi:chromosome partitioning protein
VKTIAFFNNKGGVGKTSLVYHLAWMFAKKNVRVVVADFDPQSNLTSMFLDETRLEKIWDSNPGNTILDYVTPVMDGFGDIQNLEIERIHENIGLIPGNLGLSIFEDTLSEEWGRCLSNSIRAFSVTTAFHRVILHAVTAMQADLVLIDVAPSLGAINRSALLAADQVIFPLSPDLFSLQGLKNVGLTRKKWFNEWKKRLKEVPLNYTLPLPKGEMNPLGYVLMQFGVRDNRPVKAYQYFIDDIPKAFHDHILQESNFKIENKIDKYQLKELKHYRSLMPLAMKAHKPMFSLTSADGAIGAHLEAVRKCYEDFESLANVIAERTNISLG